jgi:hypothetical protein
MLGVESQRDADICTNLAGCTGRTIEQKGAGFLLLSVAMAA